VISSCLCLVFPTAPVTDEISIVMQGIIFSAFPFGSALVSPFIGKVRLATEHILSHMLIKNGLGY
jgi:hypothetical protein